MAAPATQLTINADQHPLLKRFHKPDDEKRTLVVVPPEAYSDWLSCRDPEFARAFLNPYPHQLMQAWEEPRPPALKKATLEKQQSLLDF
jgi:putative SOS response-associated peptidase YedK